MKKITLLLAGLAISGAASATDVKLTASGDVTVLQCTLLNEDVSVNLTANVNAGVSCDGTSVAMAACHTAGRQASRSALIDTAGADCGTTGKPACTGNKVSTPVTGAAIPLATTEDGTVTSTYPGTGACDDSKASTVAAAAVAAIAAQ